MGSTATIINTACMCLYPKILFQRQLVCMRAHEAASASGLFWGSRSVTWGLGQYPRRRMVSAGKWLFIRGMREHIQTSWKFDLRPELPPPLPLLHLTSKKKIRSPDSSIGLFEEAQMCCPRTGLNSHSGQIYCNLTLEQFSLFGNVCSLLVLNWGLNWRRLFISLCLTAMHQWAALAVLSAPCKMCRVIFFLHKEENGSCHNKNIASFVFTFHSLLSHPGTRIVRRLAGWGQPNRAVDV